jgi:hypothetical protein
MIGRFADGFVRLWTVVFCSAGATSREIRISEKGLPEALFVWAIGLGRAWAILRNSTLRIESVRCRSGSTA